MKEHITEKQALEILKRHSKGEEDYRNILDHSKAVQRIALRFAEKISGSDPEFIRTAALLHDIGRFECPPKKKKKGGPGKPPIQHGIEGYRILMQEGLPMHARVAKVHLGCGITKEEVAKRGLPLPEEDMVPETKEELIITYADNLVAHDKEMDEQWAEDRFARELGEGYRKSIREFHRRIHKLIKG